MIPAKTTFTCALLSIAISTVTGIMIMNIRITIIIFFTTASIATILTIELGPAFFQAKFAREDKKFCYPKRR